MAKSLKARARADYLVSPTGRRLLKAFDEAHDAERKTNDAFGRLGLKYPDSKLVSGDSPRRVREMADTLSPSRSAKGKVQPKPKEKPKAKASSNPLGLPSTAKRTPMPAGRKVSVADAAQGMFGAKTTGKRKPLK